MLVAVTNCLLKKAVLTFCPLNIFLLWNFGLIQVFDKNKTILIYLNGKKTSFNIAKNVNGDSMNKLTTSKLVHTMSKYSKII